MKLPKIKDSLFKKALKSRYRPKNSGKRMDHYGGRTR